MPATVCVEGSWRLAGGNEMTSEEQREYARELAELDRLGSERKLHAGQVGPRNLAERELFAADLKSKREPEDSDTA